MLQAEQAGSLVVEPWAEITMHGPFLVSSKECICGREPSMLKGGELVREKPYQFYSGHRSGMVQAQAADLY